MVGDATHPIEAIGQFHRDRADCENGFDALKNRRAMSGFTTRDINRCQTTARSCELRYKWWGWYCRAANPSARMEAITSRPLLLAAVGKTASHARQTRLYLTPMHGKVSVLTSLIANIRAALEHVRLTAEQFKTTGPWACADALRARENRADPRSVQTPRCPARYRVECLSMRGSRGRIRSRPAPEGLLTRARPVAASRHRPARLPSRAPGPAGQIAKAYVKTGWEDPCPRRACRPSAGATAS